MTGYRYSISTGNALLLHRLGKLEGQHALYRLFGSCLIGALLLEIIVKVLSRVALLYLAGHFKPLILLVARSRSDFGVFRDFLIKP